MQSSRILISLVIVLSLGACFRVDNTAVNRAGTGAAIGAVAAVLVSSNPITGAVVGGAIGALTKKH